MQPTRIARLQAAILEELSIVLPRQVKDPRVPPLTLTRVELSQDAGVAKVFFALMGDMTGEGNQDVEKTKRVKDCIQGLTSASGFLKRHLSRTLQIRHTPALIFQEDRGLANTLRVHELLQQLAREPKAESAPEAQNPPRAETQEEE